MTAGSSSPPESRYGRVRPVRPSRRWFAGAFIVVVAVGLAIAVLGYRRLGPGDVDGTLAGYRLIDDRTVAVTISVTRKHPARPVDCILRVRAKDGSETGRREVLIPPSTQKTVQVTAVLKSSEPAAVGDIYGCGTDVPGYLRAP